MENRCDYDDDDDICKACSVRELCSFYKDRYDEYYSKKHAAIEKKVNRCADILVEKGLEALLSQETAAKEEQEAVTYGRKYLKKERGKWNKHGW